MNRSLLVTDAHPLLWYVKGQLHKLPKKVIKAFEDAIEGNRAIFIPLVALWEISLAIKAGKVRLATSLDEYVKEQFFAKSISVLLLEIEDVLLSQKLHFSNDPFDTLIVSMALRMKAPLITGDSVIHKQEPCEIFWD